MCSSYPMYLIIFTLKCVLFESQWHCLLQEPTNEGLYFIQFDCIKTIAFNVI